MRIVNRIYLGITAMLLAGTGLEAQRPGSGAAVDSAMAPLAWLVGEWEGRGTMQSRTGPQVAVTHEKVEGRLGGRILVFEGVGREPADTGQGRIVHHAFGILSYDPERRKYLFRAFRDGGVIDADASLADGVFVWEIAVPGGRARYRIRRDGNAWHEAGEFSTDGATWRPFFDMRLTRVGAPR